MGLGHQKTDHGLVSEVLRVTWTWLLMVWLLQMVFSGDQRIPGWKRFQESSSLTCPRKAWSRQDGPAQLNLKSKQTWSGEALQDHRLQMFPQHFQVHHAPTHLPRTLIPPWTFCSNLDHVPSLFFPGQV